MSEPLIKPNTHGSAIQSEHSVKDLVYNPETGDFEQVERGAAHEGDTVTQMSIDRFA